MIVTTSWDDGYPADVRVADLLSKVGFSGTFYVPCRNSEGRTVMDAVSLRQLSQSFEIGGHTFDHVDLKDDEAFSSRAAGAERKEFSRTRAHGVRILLPRGSFDASTQQIVRKAGFAYARGNQLLPLIKG